MRFNLGKMFTTKSLWVLANLVCTALLALQLGHVLEGYVNPTITRTWEEEVDLEDIDFPVTIKICVIPGFNQTALHEVGYGGTSLVKVSLTTLCMVGQATQKIQEQ